MNSLLPDAGLPMRTSESVKSNASHSGGSMKNSSYEVSDKCDDDHSGMSNPLNQEHSGLGKGYCTIIPDDITVWGMYKCINV